MQFLLAAVVAGLLASAEPVRAEVASPCADGTRLVVQSSGRKKPSPPRLVVVDGNAWKISPGCPEGARPAFHAHRRTVGVRVEWPGCSDPASPPTRLRGRVSADCTALRGVWRVKSPKHVERVTGQPSRCGDGVQDGEDCDGSDNVCPTSLVCSASCLCEDPALPLDPSFGTGGVVTVDRNPVALAVDGAGRMLVLAANGDNFGIRRFSTAGQLEHDAPLAEVPAGAGGEFGILPLADGGFLTNAGAIRRFDADAEPVASFGTGGKLPAALAVRELDDGRLVTFNGSDGLRRYLADGTPDPSFTPLPSPVPLDDELPRASFLGDGRLIFVARHFFNAPAMVARRVLTDGSLDPGYGNGGLFVFETRVGPVARALQLLALPDASLLVRILDYAGSHPQYGGARIGPDATADTRDVPPTEGMFALDAAGRVLVARQFVSSTALRPPRLALERRLADGTLDTTFGRSGLMLTAVKGGLFGFGNLSLDVFGLVGLPDGKVLVGAEGQILRLQP